MVFIEYVAGGLKIQPISQLISFFSNSHRVPMSFVSCPFHCHWAYIQCYVDHTSSITRRYFQGFSRRCQIIYCLGLLRNGVNKLPDVVTRNLLHDLLSCSYLQHCVFIVWQFVCSELRTSAQRATSLSLAGAATDTDSWWANYRVTRNAT